MDNLQTLTEMSMEFYGNMIDNMTGNNSIFSTNAGQLGRNALQPFRTMFNSGDCCPPEKECPPHCMASITRKAMTGERIIIPFTVHNECNQNRVYRIGVREMADQDGKTAPSQPQLNKASVTLKPHGSERVLIGLDLGKFDEGSYTADVVLREKEYNQNICLSVEVADHPSVSVTPLEEKKYRLKWQSWQSHFYCESRKSGSDSRG
ncbi:MAG: hypothetical protein AAF363_18010 [Bacteroidota bacterium]